MELGRLYHSLAYGLISFLQYHCLDAGSHVECQYILKTFGIPVNFFPLDVHGNNVLDHYVKYLAERRRIEKEQQIAQEFASKGQKEIVEPTNKDILLGRGRPYQGKRIRVLAFGRLFLN